VLLLFILLQLNWTAIYVSGVGNSICLYSMMYKCILHNYVESWVNCSSCKRTILCLIFVAEMIFFSVCRFLNSIYAQNVFCFISDHSLNFYCSILYFRKSCNEVWFVSSYRAFYVLNFIRQHMLLRMQHCSCPNTLVSDNSRASAGLLQLKPLLCGRPDTVGNIMCHAHPSICRPSHMGS